MLAGVRTARFDGAMLPGDTSTGPGSQLEADRGETSEAAAEGRQRWFGATLFATSYLALNPDGALRDPVLRRAIALAIDRAALADIWPFAPTADLLPSSLEGVPSTAVPAPDIDAARTLLAGLTLELTLATPEVGECDPCDAFALELAAQLGALGITVESQRSDDPWADADRPETNVDLLELGFGSEIPDAGALLLDFRDRPWVPADVKDEIDRIQTLASQARIDAANALARRLTDDHLIIPYGSPVYANYFASDIGCAAIQPAIGAVDLSSLCRLRPTT
jgi:ABC-type transport system substrate-binding protein